MTIACGLEANNLKEAVGSLDEEINTVISSIKNDMDKELDELNDEAPDGPENKIGLDFDVKWEDKKISFHVPTVHLEDKSIGNLHIPEFEMKPRDIIFHTPSVRMVDRVIGRHPNITCHGLSCDTTWSDIIISVPETIMQEQKITIQSPELTMKQQEIIMGIPIFEMVLQSFNIKVPIITLRSISVAADSMNDDAKRIQDKYNGRIKNEIENIKDKLKINIEKPHSNLFNCIKGGLEMQKASVLTQFDATIQSLKDSISQMKSNNIPDDNDYLKSINDSLHQVEQDRQKQIEFYASKLIEMDENQKQSLEKIYNSLQIGQIN